MAKARRPDPRVDRLPTIIIDPSLYESEPRFLLQRVCEGFFSLTKAALVAVLVGTATFAIGQGIEARSFALPTRVPAAVHESTLDASANESARELVYSYVAEQTPWVAAPVVSSSGEAAVKPVRHRRDLSDVVRDARRLLAHNRLEDAEAAYRRVLNLRDGQPAALLGLSRVQLARGQLDEALELAERAVDKTPDQVACHLTLGDVLRARGATQAADTQYQLALLLSPTHTRDRSE